MSDTSTGSSSGREAQYWRTNGFAAALRGITTQESFAPWRHTMGRSIQPSDGDGSPLKTPERTAADRLKALETVATDILGHLDLEATLLSVINGAVSLLGADIAGILLAEGGRDLRMRACRGHRSIESVRLVAQRGQGVAGKVFETGKPCRIDDYP